MDYLFVGCVKLSYALLEMLIHSRVNIVGVITKKDSGYNADYADLGSLCEKYNIDWCHTDDINGVDSQAFIERHSPDVGLCMGWNQLLSEKTIRLFPSGVVGHHPADLPYNRGHHPIIWAIVLGLNQTASSFFMLDRGADTGDIISQEKIEICSDDDAQKVYDKVVDTSKKQLCEIIDRIENNTLIRTKQSRTQGNTWRRRVQKDGVIDWRMSSLAIYNLIRGLTHPYVGASFFYKDQEIKVWKSKIVESSIIGITYEPGRILGVNADKSVDVKTYDGVIRLLEFEYDGIMREGDYL